MQLQKQRMSYKHKKSLLLPSNSIQLKRILIFTFLIFDAVAKLNASNNPLIDSVKNNIKLLATLKTFAEKKYISNAINKQLSELATFNEIDKLDSVEYVTILKSNAKNVLILSWEIATDSNSFEYFCKAFLKTKTNWKSIDFDDKSDEIKNAENAATTSKKWYGAHYYQLTEKKFNDKIYYTLIGINWKSNISKIKVIEVWTVDANNNLILGEPIIKCFGRMQRRLILEYKYDISISCRYNEEYKMIVFDHLVPPHPSLKTQKQFYVSDLSFDGLKFTKGIWVLIEDIDARNKKAKDDETISIPK